MNKVCKITIIGFVLLLLDLGLTVYYVRNYPDIVGEGNMVANNNQYGYLVFVLNFLYLIFVFIVSLIYARYKTITTEATSTFSYIKKLYASEYNSFIIANFSFTFLVSTFVSRLTAILDWIIFGFYKENFFSSTYASIRSTMIMGRYDIVAGLIAGLVAIPLWFRLEFLKSKKALDPQLSNN